MLMPYLVRYRLSRSRILPQGLEQSEQNSPTLSTQFLILQEAQYAGFEEELLQPEQILFSRRKPLHRAQFIPQGAIISGTIASTVTFSTTLHGSEHFKPLQDHPNDKVGRYRP